MIGLIAMSSHEQDKQTAEYEKQAKELEEKKRSIAERAGYSGS